MLVIDEVSMLGARTLHGDEGKTFRQRFTTIVMLNEQVQAAGDPKLQQLLTRICQGVQDRSNVDLLKGTCYRGDRRISWETSITVATKDSQRTEEEALMILNYGDDSSVPVLAIFMFGLRLVNGASYTALDIILNKAYLGHRVSANTILYFGPLAGILLAAETTRGFHSIGIPRGTILLTLNSVKIEC
ncbi:hypothetical protein CC80DRAFT_512285 [Byssothecium circinans]|uniref:Uncharacterized protein n=1 Tax=Byssothecium circinans TaxID=147558 RepID=A0A6A5UH25_9PLEO|nr:hypothetical protein CC80DRAFT_512285 [Byssothecium circinans]